jgi:NADH:ubiquinone oxidoreductase subunit 2 (subunit N)
MDLSNLESLFLNQMSVSVEHIKTQELTFLAEYYLITALFCLTLFALFSLKLVIDEKHFLIKFQYNNQLIFLLIFGLTCYLILVYQQMDLSLLALTSFNDTMYNDQLSFISKLIIGISSILYLTFITQYLKDQKLSNFEYYIILLTSIFGFFLLCGANDLITAYLAIELQGLAFYVLASFKKSSNFSIESGVKYFVLGSLSTAIFLLGVTFIYGLSGSVLLTDFRDFFIWVFSANSFFLSFESIYKALESFQEKISVTENSHLAKLQVISDKLDLFKKKAYLLSSDTKVLDFSYNDLATKTNNSEEILLCNNISEKMIEVCNPIAQIDSIDKDLLKTINNLSSMNDFLIESTFQNASVELLYVLQDNQLNYSSFLNFKNCLLEANFYEDEDLESFFGFSIDESKINDESFSFFQMNNNLVGNYCVTSIYNLVQCCYLSEVISNVLQFAESIQTSDTTINELPQEIMLDNKFYDEFTKILMSDTSVLNSVNDLTVETSSFGLKNWNSKSYLFSVVNIVNFNNLFLEPFNLNGIEYQFMFDFSFAVSGMLIIIFALFFKLALAPFHLWSPDVYEGSPSSSTFFFMIISKFSIFVFLLRICYSSFYSLISYWQFYSIIVATISIFIGAVAGLKQRRLKSLLTYSSINNMGFVLLAFSVGSFEGVQMKFFYLIVYIISGLCIWSIILNLKLKKKMYSEKQNRDLGDYALLQESNHVVAQSLAITLFTLAGLPPMVGFLAKMGVFKALSGVSIYFFSLVNILFTVIATFYYIRIIKIIFFENLLVGKLYATINTKKTFLINLLTFLLMFLFVSPMFLYFYTYKMTLFLNKSFY